MTQEEFDAAFCSDDNVRYPDDCRRIQRVAKERLGVDITLAQAQTIWEDHSDSYCAGWLGLERHASTLAEEYEIVGAIEHFVTGRRTTGL
jgi:hypothetical protein